MIINTPRILKRRKRYLLRNSRTKLKISGTTEITLSQLTASTPCWKWMMRMGMRRYLGTIMLPFGKIIVVE